MKIWLISSFIALVVCILLRIATAMIAVTEFKYFELFLFLAYMWLALSLTYVASTYFKWRHLGSSATDPVLAILALSLTFVIDCIFGNVLLPTFSWQNTFLFAGIALLCLTIIVIFGKRKHRNGDA